MSILYGISYMCNFYCKTENCLSGFFKNPDIIKNDQYKYERAKAYTKIACLPNLLLDALAVKSGIELDNDESPMIRVQQKRDDFVKNLAVINCNDFKEDEEKPKLIIK